MPFVPPTAVDEVVTARGEEAMDLRLSLGQHRDLLVRAEGDIKDGPSDGGFSVNVAANSSERVAAVGTAKVGVVQANRHRSCSSSRCIARSGPSR